MGQHGAGGGGRRTQPGVPGLSPGSGGGGPGCRRRARPALPSGAPRAGDHRGRPRRAALRGVGSGREPPPRPEGAPSLAARGGLSPRHAAYNRAMPRANEQVEAVLNEYRDLLSVTGDDPFKARAYEKAARSIGGFHADIRDFELKELLEIPNVGKSIAEKVAEYLHSGTMPALEELRAQIPAGVSQLTSIPMLGRKKAM